MLALLKVKCKTEGTIFAVAANMVTKFYLVTIRKMPEWGGGP